MAVMVQKYGGSSLADARAIRRCAARAVREHDAGHQVVVVVSAMGTTTDGLLALAGQLTDRPGPRALDLLLATGEQISTSLMVMAVQSLGVDAVGLAAGDIGISTVGRHGEARVRDVDAARIRRHLAARRIVVVAGFQGRNEDGRATTLGRGGSDITAVALAAALDIGAGGGCCEICSDVDGVYTADPRLVPEVRKLDRLLGELAH